MREMGRDYGAFARMRGIWEVSGAGGTEMTSLLHVIGDWGVLRGITYHMTGIFEISDLLYRCLMQFISDLRQ